MDNTGQTWALVLAAGDGNRLRSLTTTSSGVAVPKQFCSLRGGPSLLHEALQRAEAVATREHICTVVAQQHQRWWEQPLQHLPPGNVIVQPQNRGTANGILLPLLHILARDPQARIVLLPSDQHVSDEGVLAKALQRAVAQLKAEQRDIVLLGIEPDEADPELGYIIPGEITDHGTHAVQRFIEKPPAALATELIDAGALWNAFIVVARAQALLELFTSQIPQVVADMQAVVAHDSSQPTVPTAAEHLYRVLPDIDFSRHIAQGCESALRVLAVPSCGWSDLGTPKRVIQTLRKNPVRHRAERDCSFPLGGQLSLAAQHALLQATH